MARLAVADATANELAEPYEMSLQAIYKHLRVLEEAGLVSRPAGRQPRPVCLEMEAFDLMDAWIERYRRRGPRALPVPRPGAGHDARDRRAGGIR